MLHPTPNNTGNYMKKEELRNFFSFTHSKMETQTYIFIPCPTLFIKSLCARVFRVRKLRKIFSSFSKKPQNSVF